MKKYSYLNGVLAFVLVLLMMPLGHSIMVLIEVFLKSDKLLGAALLGILGFVALFWGYKKNEMGTTATVLGFLASIFIWTGWVEFSFVWIAEKNNVLPEMRNGEITTKPEYLVMMSTLGLLLTILAYYFFSRSNCTFFIWFQKIFKIKNQVQSQNANVKSKAVITFMETIVIMWFFYILLLLIYDETILGERHFFTYFVAWGSLFWSMFLFFKLVKIRTFDYSIRYAIPTVVIFWNFIEILGRWNLFKEIWVHPIEHWIEVTLFCAAFLIFFGLIMYNPRFHKKRMLS